MPFTIPFGVLFLSVLSLNWLGEAFGDGTNPSSAALGSTAAWSLNTDTTQLKLTLRGEKLYLDRLSNTQNHWNWISVPLTVPLPEMASGNGLTWHFQDAHTDASFGTRVTFRFVCNTPHLELWSTWCALPGSGPVECQSFLQNTSDREISFFNRDFVSGNFDLVADSNTTLHRFCKLADVSRDDRANTPVISTPLVPGLSIVAYARNAIEDHPADIPMQVFDVGSNHGLYLGYEWSFGRFEIGTKIDPRHVSYRALLWADGQTTLGPHKTLAIPAMYLGAYSGDLDDGGNQFKRWFWKYKITASLRANSNEPLLEYCVPGNEEGLTKFFADYPVASWGGDLAKVDIDWLPKGDGPNKDWFGPEVAEWKPDPAKWPHGMTARQMALHAGQKLALYMPHSYEYCDLGTDAGRAKDLQALLTRYDAGMYDYYRSDFVVEGSFDFHKHEGFLQVLDALIAQRPAFRYENCSAGGTLKDFSTLQRSTFVTTDDSATPDGHRESLYSNSYFINPVQLKADIAISGGPGSDQDPIWVRYCLRTGFMGANMATNTGKFTPAMIAETKLAWPLYATRMRPILRGADVYHILPPIGGNDWDGLQYDNPILGKGAVLLFKSSAKAPDNRTIKLRGLDRAAIYQVNYQDRTSQDTTLSGARLMDSGLSVVGMTGAYASEIIWIGK